MMEEGVVEILEFCLFQDYMINWFRISRLGYTNLSIPELYLQFRVFRVCMEARIPVVSQSSFHHHGPHVAFAPFRLLGLFVESLQFKESKKAHCHHDVKTDVVVRESNVVVSVPEVVVLESDVVLSELDREVPSSDLMGSDLDCVPEDVECWEVEVVVDDVSTEVVLVDELFSQPLIAADLLVDELSSQSLESLMDVTVSSSNIVSTDSALGCTVVCLDLIMFESRFVCSFELATSFDGRCSCPSSKSFVFDSIVLILSVMNTVLGNLSYTEVGYWSTVFDPGGIGLVT